MSERYICIHGHFYQPPRENPWLEAIELQDSAHPFHDWNERITAECYGPNAASRILDDRGFITDIVNNYSRISFNFGPTLLSWLELHAPAVYAAILEADALSQERFGGHGSAVAQCYNHMIMPLASPRDRRTQVVWGVRDFESRFGRKPEGMWLPETAVDIASLEALAEQGITFTILAPRQARRVRPLGPDGEPAGDWEEVGEGVDSRRAYLQRLPSGRTINLFFYDGPISRALAFENLLERGEHLVGRMVGAFDAEPEEAQLAHIATDGESYGHHHRHGDMALAYALHRIEEREEVALTNYGQFLELHPPEFEVEIVEDSSWSCAHGVGRWASDCGCSTGGRAGWNQQWRAPLRGALDWLRDRIEEPFAERGGELFVDPWAARDAYIEVVLDRSRAPLQRFFEEQTDRVLSRDERVEALKLMEMQRHAMLMYTSCGWFFNELSGIETVQVIQYAARVVQLAAELFAIDVEEPFLERLSRAKSNLARHGNGRQIYESSVRPTAIELSRVAAHHAISLLFNLPSSHPQVHDGEGLDEESEFSSDPEVDQEDVLRSRTYCYRVENLRKRRFRTGGVRAVVGRCRITSLITRERDTFDYAALHLGDHNVAGGVGAADDARFELICEQVSRTFERAEFPDLIRVFDREFGKDTFTVRSLFRDKQRKVIDHILQSARKEAEASFRRIYQQRAPLLRFLDDLGIRKPEIFQAAAQIVLQTELRQALENRVLDRDEIASYLENAEIANVELEPTVLRFALERNLEVLSGELGEEPTDREALRRLEVAVEVVRSLPFEVSLAEPQNVYYDIARSLLPTMRERAEADDRDAHRWVERFERMSAYLKVALP